MLLSSLAESVYWFARYIERSEIIARMILVNDGLLLDIPPHCNSGWAALINISGGSDLFYRHYDAASERNVIRYLPRAVSHCLMQLEQSLYALAVDGVPRQALADARRKLNDVDAGALVGGKLHHYVDELQLQFIAINDELALRYFAAGEQPPVAVNDTGPAAQASLDRCQPPTEEAAIV